MIQINEYIRKSQENSNTFSILDTCQVIAQLNREERRKLAVIERQLPPSRRRELRGGRNVFREQHWEHVERFLLSLTPLRQLIVNELMKYGRAFPSIEVASAT